jgi:hypothetical protein
MKASLLALRALTSPIACKALEAAVKPLDFGLDFTY